MIYFIAEETLEYVKIGYTEGNAYDRIKGLSTGNPRKLIILAFIDGSMAKEKKLHKQFSEYRVRGEWFKYEGKLKSYIQSLNGIILSHENETYPIIKKIKSKQYSYNHYLRKKIYKEFMSNDKIYGLLTYKYKNAVYGHRGRRASHGTKTLKISNNEWLLYIYHSEVICLGIFQSYTEAIDESNILKLIKDIQYLPKCFRITN